MTLLPQPPRSHDNHRFDCGRPVLHRNQHVRQRRVSDRPKRKPASLDGHGRSESGSQREAPKAKKVEVLRQPAEVKYAEELAYLASVDTGKRPFSWKLSPRMIRTFILGSTPADKIERPIAQKFSAIQRWSNVRS